MSVNYLKTGDKLSRQKNGIITHYGIFVRFPNGQCFVAENNVDSGVQFVTFQKFLNGEKFYNVKPFSGTELQRKQIIPSINRKIGTPYYVFSYNCEHFVNEILHGVLKSPQASFATGALILTALYYATRPNC
jgi:hypothetical protein